LTVVDFDPVALDLGPIQVHWYGLMYLAAFLAGWWLARVRAPRHGWRKEEIGDLLFYAAMGVVIGGRLGYVIFYDPSTYLANPIRIFYLQQGGMSFHGGLLGVLVAMWWYGRATGRTFFAVTDFLAPVIPPGLFFGRIGNFINGELWGAPTDAPYAMVFAKAGPLPRHPSMLYEAALEGLVLFAILWWYARKPRPLMAVSGLFLIGYGVFRFLVEFVRVPDEGLGYLLFDWVTMGQLLSAPMVLSGLALFLLAQARDTIAVQAAPAEAKSTEAPSAPSNAAKRRRKKQRRRQAQKS
jgi:phosphatidylglycerol:prolipoprotein diacylglycerol transferase